MKYPSIFYYLACNRHIITAYPCFYHLTGTLLPEISNLLFKTPQEIQVELGSRLRRLRLDRNLDQISTAGKAGISEKALRNLESGHGSTVETLVRVLKALDFLQGIDMLAPEITVNPLELLRRAKAPRQRARRTG